ncbi:hypothetical protein Asp14428_38140 [Actinoplanes sp. NBRC 14428]|nr:hypothetical protein Asp14428_38140 [Actinoplanes sp. NBRC 14428]
MSPDTPAPRPPSHPATRETSGAHRPTGAPRPPSHPRTRETPAAPHPPSHPRTRETSPTPHPPSHPGTRETSPTPHPGTRETSGPARRRSGLRRLLTALAVVFALAAAPAVVAPDPAAASVYSSCTMSRCDAARTARTGWSQLGWPTSAGWYTWPYGQYNYTGGTFQNRERQLPTNASYNEYDVYPRAKGASRDAYRIVVNRSTKETWFTPDHYVNFYKL